MEATTQSASVLAAVFAAEADAVFGFLLARCGSRPLAEDLTADTFIDANRVFRAGRGGEVTRSWLFTVARRRLIDHWRAESARQRRIARLQSEARRTNEPRRAHATFEPDEPDVAGVLESLSERYRAALVLRYLEDFSVSEVADALGLSYKATESVLSRARVAFSRSFEEYQQ